MAATNAAADAAAGDHRAIGEATDTAPATTTAIDPVTLDHTAAVLTQVESHLAEEIAGLDALDIDDTPRRRLAGLWSSSWPKIAAVMLALAIWQLVVWSKWKPEYVLPAPATALDRLWAMLGEGSTWAMIGTTLRRAATGFAIALAIGTLIGIAVSMSRFVRTAVGSLITGFQTMPSVAWFPLALVLFRLSEGAILFVVVLGAAPSIANGLINGVDQIPPVLLRAGRVLGTRRLTHLRHVVLPGALPGFFGGLKQGWAFAWRSLLAGELLVIIANKPSIGSQLQFARDVNDYPAMIAVMIIILVIGVLIDSLVFAGIERGIRRRRGLTA
ncbi:MAG TPA: ABC transporter permease [Ilumatobacteraceae bacterium]|nr:ABC transporter permease [Ilumatobacteraceae bacterium]